MKCIKGTVSSYNKVTAKGNLLLDTGETIDFHLSTVWAPNKVGPPRQGETVTVIIDEDENELREVQFEPPHLYGPMRLTNWVIQAYNSAFSFSSKEPPKILTSYIQRECRSAFSVLNGKESWINLLNFKLGEFYIIELAAEMQGPINEDFEQDRILNVPSIFKDISGLESIVCLNDILNCFLDAEDPLLIQALAIVPDDVYRSGATAPLSLVEASMNYRRALCAICILCLMVNHANEDEFKKAATGIAKHINHGIQSQLEIPKLNISKIYSNSFYNNRLFIEMIRRMP